MPGILNVSRGAIRRVSPRGDQRARPDPGDRSGAALISAVTL